MKEVAGTVLETAALDNIFKKFIENVNEFVWRHLFDIIWVTSFVFVPNLWCDEAACSVVCRHRPGSVGVVELVPKHLLCLELQVNDEILTRLAGSVPIYLIVFRNSWVFSRFTFLWWLLFVLFSKRIKDCMVCYFD